MMLYSYLDERRTVKYWKKVVWNIFGRMVLNSYILYKLNTTEKPLNRYQYIVSIIDDIAEEWLGQNQQDPDGGGDKLFFFELGKLKFNPLLSKLNSASVKTILVLFTTLGWKV